MTLLTTLSLKLWDLSYFDNTEKKIKKILNNKELTLQEKQFKLETTFSFLSTEKTLNSVKINPYWQYNILKLFKINWYLFYENLQYLLSQNSIKKKLEQFYLSNFLLSISEQDLIIFYIFQLITLSGPSSNFKKFSSKETDFSIKKNTFITFLSENFLIFFSSFFINTSFIFFLNNYKILSSSSSKLSISFELLDSLIKHFLIFINKNSLSPLITFFTDSTTVNLLSFHNLNSELFMSEILSIFYNFYHEIHKNNLLEFFKNLFAHITTFLEQENIINLQTNYNTFSKYNVKLNVDYIALFIPSPRIYNEILNLHYSTIYLPMIVKPIDWTFSNQSTQEMFQGGYLSNTGQFKLVHNLKFGKSSTLLTNYSLNAINLTQKKPYKLNIFFLKLLNSEKVFSYINIVNYKELKNAIKIFNNSLIFYLNNLEPSINLDKYYLNFSFFSKFISKKNYFKKNFKNIFNIFVKNNLKLSKINLKNILQKKYNISNEILLKFEDFLSKRKELVSKISNFYKFYYFKSIANLFKNYTLYFPNFYDFRLCYYPFGWSFHKASGLYKYLLESSEMYSCLDAKTVYGDKRRGSIYLARFIVSNFTKKKFKGNYAIDKFFDNKLYDLIIKKYDSFNPFNFLTNFNLINEPLIFLYGVNEYYNIITNIDKDSSYSSSFLLDFDQTCSDAQIISLLSNDKQIANLTNLTALDKNNDLYLDFLSKFLKNFPNKLKLKSLDFANFNRKFAKSVVMPFYYGLGLKGIKSKCELFLFSETNSKEYKVKLKLEILNNFNSKNLYMLLLAKYIYFLIKKEYTILYAYYHFLKNLAKTFFIYNKYIYFKLPEPDGSLIAYKYLLQTKIPKKIKNPYLNKTFNFVIYKYSSKLDPQHFTTFAPNFIQSLDECISRFILLNFYEKYNIILEPLHDSFRLHHTQIDLLYPIIKKIYFELFKNSDSFIFENFISLTPLTSENSLKLKKLWNIRPKGNLILDYATLKKSKFMFSV